MYRMSQIANKFGRRLRFLRSINKLTQADLAEKICVSSRHISRFECGRSFPSFFVLEHLCYALNTSMASLFLFCDNDKAYDGLYCDFSSGIIDAEYAIKYIPKINGLCLLCPFTSKMSWSASLYKILGYKPYAIKPSVDRFLKNVHPLFKKKAATFINNSLHEKNDVKHILVELINENEIFNKVISIRKETIRKRRAATDEIIFVFQDITDWYAIIRSFVNNQDQWERYIAERNDELALAVEKYQVELNGRRKAEFDLNICVQMVNASMNAQAFVNDAGIFIVVNKECESVLGLSKKLIVGRNHTDVMVEVLGNNIYEKTLKPHFDNAMLHNIPVTFSEWIKFIKGSVRYFKINYYPAFIDKNISGVFITVIDMTEHMIMQEKVVNSEKIYKQIYENTKIGIAELSLDYHVERANEAYCEMLGYNKTEFIGKNIRDFTHHDSLEDNMTLQNQLAQGSCDHYRLEKKFLHKNGHTIYGILDANLIRDSKGDPYRFVGTVLDITKRKEMEESLRQREELVELVSSITLELLLCVDLQKTFNRILAQLGRNTLSDRVYICKNHRDENSGLMTTSCIYEWVRLGVAPHFDNRNLHKVPHAACITRWLQNMKAGEVIKGHVKDFPEKERDILEQQNVQSVLAVPIQIDNSLWGFLGFDFVRSMHVCTLAEESILRTVAIALATTVNRKNAEELVLIKGLAVDSSLDAIAVLDLQGFLNYVNPAFINLWDFKNENEALQRHFISLWKNKEKATHIMRHILDQGYVNTRMVAKQNNGRMFTVNANASIIYDKDNDPVGITTSFRLSTR